MSISINGFDHVALSVSHIDESVAFYEEVLGLKQIQRPDFKFPGAWFGFGNGQALHLIGKREGRATQDHHFALRIDDLDKWLAHLQALQVEFKGPNPRPDGIQQIFFQDPDGNLIELDYEESAKADG